MPKDVEGESDSSPSLKRELGRYKGLFAVAGATGALGLSLTSYMIYLNMSTWDYAITLGMVVFGLVGISYGVFSSQRRYYKSIPDFDSEEPN